MNRFFPTTVGVILVTTTLFLSGCAKSVSQPTPSPSAVVDQQLLITQTIDYGGRQPTETATISTQLGKSALDLLTTAEKTEVKEYSFGKLVESVNGVKNGADNKYWLYYVNGSESKVGAGDYMLKSGDVIEWKFKAYEE